MTFITFQVFWEAFKSPKTWISWSGFSLGEILRISCGLPKTLTFNNPQDLIKTNYLVKKMKMGHKRRKTHRISVFFIINQTCVCVLTKTRVCFFPPSFSVSFDHWSGWPHAQGFFSSFDMDRFLKYSSPLGTLGSSTWLTCDLMSSNAGLQWPFCALWRGWLDREWEKGDVCREKRGRVIEQCEKDLLAHISLPDLLHNRSGKANSRVVVKLQSWKSWY